MLESIMTVADIKARLEMLYDRQESDEWPPKVAKKIRDDIDRLEKLLRERDQ